MLNIFLGTGAAAGANPGIWGSMIWIVIMFGIFYFIAIRPQKKQEKEHALLVDSAEIGDSVLTSSGFYGVIIDSMEEIVIVEFGNNKNCRIPMKRSAIVEVEKPGQANEGNEEK
ncbi:MAG TPA: preprotein translocase subunit YajC [Clostridiales bacterium]|nr:preprotein translocase subunit YajC [Clostridiales bacterium]